MISWDVNARHGVPRGTSILEVEVLPATQHNMLLQDIFCFLFLSTNYFYPDLYETSTAILDTSVYILV